MRINSKNRANSKHKKGQTTLELAMMLAMLAFLLTPVVSEWVNFHNLGIAEIDARNTLLAGTRNATMPVPDISKFKMPDLTKFDIPGRRHWTLPFPSPEDLIPNATDALLKRLGLDSDDSWWKAGIKGAVTGYVTSDFDINEAGWGALGGVTSSGDATNFFKGTFGEIAGAGLQGFATGAIVSHEQWEHGGDWRFAFLSGAQAMWSTDKMQNLIKKPFGSVDIIPATINGAVIGALNSEKGGEWGAVLQGGLTGMVGSSTLQKPLANITGNRDYLINAVNSAAMTTITRYNDPGLLRNIFTNSASAAFSSASVQNMIFGKDPSALMTSLSNVTKATFAGSMQAIQNKDASYIYLNAGQAAINETLSLTFQQMFPAPSDPEKMKGYMQKKAFVTGLATQGIMMLVDKDFAMDYAQMLAQQLAFSAAGDQINSLTDRGMDYISGEERSTEGPEIDHTGIEEEIERLKQEGKDKEAQGQGPQTMYNSSDEFKLSSNFINNVDEVLKNNMNTQEVVAAIENEVRFAKASNAKILYASNDNNFIIARRSTKVNQSTAPVNKKSLKQPDESSEKNKKDLQSKFKPTSERLAKIFEVIETMPAEKIIHGRFYAAIVKSRPMAKKILREELKRNLKIINAVHLSKYGYLDDEIEQIINSKDFNRALNKAVNNKAVKERIDYIVNHATSKKNIHRVITQIKQRIIKERAFHAELQLRKLTWTYNKKATIYSKDRRQNIIIKVYEKIKG